MTPSNLILAILATYRITNLFVNEEGPYNIFGKIRTKLQIYNITLEDGTVRSIVNELNRKHYMVQLSKLLTCIWCLSPYIAVIVLLMLSNDTLKYLVYPFAISAGAIVVSRFTNH